MVRSLVLTLLVFSLSTSCLEAYSYWSCYGDFPRPYCAPPTPHCHCEEPFPCYKYCYCSSKPPPKPAPPVENNPPPPPALPKPTPPVEKNPPPAAATKPNPPSPKKPQPQPPKVDNPSPSTPNPPVEQGNYPKCPNPRDYCQISEWDFYIVKQRKKCWCSLQQCEGCFAQIWTAVIHDFTNVSKKCCKEFLRVDRNCHKLMFERFGYKWFVYRLKQHCSQFN